MSLFRRHHKKPTVNNPGTGTGPVSTDNSFVPVIAVINESTVISDAELTPIVAALQIQCDRDFAPLWNMTAKLVQVFKGQTPAPTVWQLVVLDNSDQAGALGYHDFTTAGKPIAKVFAATDQQYGAKVSVTMSHELLEMLADSGVDLAVQKDATSFVAYEVCDAVEDDSLGYDINGVTVSDFVTPEYFMQTPPAGSKMDFRTVLSQPFTIAAGGYLGIWDPTNGWTQSTNGELKTPSRVEKR